MSLGSELDELVKWISDLSAKPQPEPTPQAVYRENWRRVSENLTTVTETFTDATAALDTAKSTFVDFALDLRRQAEALQIRAHMLELRAPSEPPPEPEVALTDTMAQLIKAKQELDGVEKELDDAKAELKLIKTHPHPEETPPPPKTPPPPETPPPPLKVAVERLAAASRTLGTALENVFEGIGHPDAVSRAFERELDLLSEMTLSLRQQLAAGQPA